MRRYVRATTCFSRRCQTARQSAICSTCVCFVRLLAQDCNPQTNTHKPRRDLPPSHHISNYITKAERKTRPTGIYKNQKKKTNDKSLTARRFGTGSDDPTEQHSQQHPTCVFRSPALPPAFGTHSHTYICICRCFWPHHHVARSHPFS